MSNRIKPSVHLIVLTYNSVRSDFLDGCFGSLEKMETEGLDVRVVAVDNASSDGTPDEIRRRWPWVTVMESGGNVGFAAGNNIAMARALDEGADYVFLLNHDTEVEPHFLVEAVRVAEADRSIGSVQSLLIQHPERDLVNSAGNAIHFLGFGYCRNYRQPVAEIDSESVRDIAYASGAAVLYRTSALREVGLFDDTFFMYHEDLDLGWRMLLRGYRNVLAPKSVVWHKYEFSRSIGKWYYMERNRYLTLLKNCRLRTLIVLLPGLLATEAAMSVPAVRGGWWQKKLRALGYFLRPATWRHVFRERDRVAAMRRVGDREVFALFTPTIRDQESPSLFAIFIANPLMERTWKVIRVLIR